MFAIPRRLRLGALARASALAPALTSALASTLVLLTGAALAQESAPNPAVDAAQQAPMQLAQAEFERHQIFINEGHDFFAFAGGDMAGGRVVKGAPYCAEAVHETVQLLADASGGAPNRIVNQQVSRLCRDSEGRTRQETERGKRRIVYLRDPVARESWVLDLDRKTARRLGDARLAVAPVPPVPPVTPTPSGQALPPAAGPQPTPVIITKGGEGGTREAHVRIVRMHGDPDAHAGDWPMPPPPPVQWRAQHGAPRGAGTTTPLAAKDIEGLRANGERTTWTIDAGKVGNERPIQIVREVWTAPDLMLTVSSRDFDPRSGEVNYRLRNLKRGEPDAALLRVPADFAKPAARPTTPRASGPTG